MGNQRARRQAFFSAHPHCCFCGGTVPATEIDHIPARHLFRRREWPEGYEFPACYECNHASSLDELVMGALVRIQVSDVSAEDEREMEDAFSKLNRRRPEWINAMREFSRNETRRSLRQQGLSLKSFPGNEIYMMEMPEEIIGAARRYAEKLGRALYYKATGTALPSTGLIRAKHLTNVQWMSPTFPPAGFEALNTQPPMTRSRKDLSDQFAYRYGATPDGSAAAFWIQFRESVGMVVFAFKDEAQYRQAKALRQAASEAA